MRSRVLVHTILAALVATSTLTGCKGGFHWPWAKKTSTTQPGSQPPPVTGTGGDHPLGERPIIGGAGEVQRGQFAPVYFDYDSARVKPSEMSKLEAVANALKANTKKLIIEGHTDERGTAEYNRALGERRAGSAREALIRLGIDTSRISTVSYGKEKPADPGHDEAAGAKNRRDEFVITSQ